MNFLQLPIDLDILTKVRPFYSGLPVVAPVRTRIHDYKLALMKPGASS
jgi:hypothetical protein